MWQADPSALTRYGVSSSAPPALGSSWVFARADGLPALPVTCGRACSLLESGHPSVLSARPSLGCHAGQARGCWEHVPSSQGLGDPGLTRRPCLGWAVAQGSQAIVLLLLLPWAQGFEWQAAHLGGTWRPLQACCLHIPASRFPPGRVPPQDSALAFASEAVARQPRPWVHRGGMGSALEATALWPAIQTQFQPWFSPSS